MAEPISLSANTTEAVSNPVTVSEVKPASNPMEQLSQAFQVNPTQANPSDFSTLQLMFQTTNYSDLQNQGMNPAASSTQFVPQ